MDNIVCDDKDTAEEQLMNKILESFQRISELKTLKSSKKLVERL